MKTVASFYLMMTLGAGAALASDAAAGKDFYAKRCKACHAEDGSGAPAMKKKFGDKLRALDSKGVQALKDPDLAKAIKAGDSHKALAKSITDAEINNVIAFIRSLKK
jgi:mono/diheme cytochrome c family protein